MPRFDRGFLLPEKAKIHTKFMSKIEKFALYFAGGIDAKMRFSLR
jgi:hypothetical protein